MTLIQEYAKEKQLKVVGSFSDAKAALKPFSRPGFIKMINMIERGQADTILCENIARLTCNQLEADVLRMLMANGKLKSIQTNYHLYNSQTLNLLNNSL